jgi:hypothetical protein
LNCADPSSWPEALVLAVQWALELLDCFVRAARLDLQEADSERTTSDDAEGAEVHTRPVAPGV